MEAYSLLLTTSSFTLEAILILRARQQKFISKFPLFYSCIAYVFAASGFTLLVYWLRPQYHASVYWFRYMITLLAEFAVLAEISDHMFNPYPAIRQLGRFLTVSICITFFFVYIFPALTETRPSSLIILDLAKRTSLTKAVIIIGLMAAARYYRLPLGVNISGMMLGFSIYLAANVVNFSLAEKFGREIYGETFSTVLRSSYVTCLLVWAIALWRYEPALPVYRKPAEGSEGISESLSCRLDRFNTALTRLLRR